MNKKWTQEENNKLKTLVDEGYSSNEIGILMNRPGYNIQNRWQYLGLKRPKPLTNESFFDVIDTEEKAYFLGLLYADGCIATPKYGQKRMCINLNSCDRHILETFKEYLGFKYELQFNEISKRNYKFKSKDQYILRVNSNKICNDLIKHGCIPRKSLILEFPKTISDNLIRHFIRGLFDGDGCIRKRNNDKNYKPSFKFEIVGTYHICESINKLFTKLFGFKHTKLQFHKNCYKYSIGGSSQVEKIFYYLYGNSNPKLRLFRKFQIFKEIINYENKPKSLSWKEFRITKIP